MGNSSVEVTEESRDKSQEAKAKAMEAISEGYILITCRLIFIPLSASISFAKILYFISTTSCVQSF